MWSNGVAIIEDLQACPACDYRPDNSHILWTIPCKNTEKSINTFCFTSKHDLILQLFYQCFPIFGKK